MYEEADEVSEYTLRAWEEVVGRLEKIEKSGSRVRVYLKISGDLKGYQFKINSSEDVESVFDQLKDIPVGTGIGLLSTDLFDKPVLVRIVEGFE